MSVKHVKPGLTVLGEAMKSDTKRGSLKNCIPLLCYLFCTLFSEKFRVASVSSSGGSKDYLYNEDLVSPSSAVSNM